MKKIVMAGMLSLSAGLLPLMAWGNQFDNRAPGFEMPNGPIAYMGAYFSPLRIHQTGSDTQFLIPKDSRLFANPFFVADKTQAVNETNQALIEVATDQAMLLSPVPYSEGYQNALLMHVLNPAKYRYNPGISTYCGTAPYILIVIIDFYAEFSSSVNIRESENDQKINYFGQRSLLEKDRSVFAIKGRQRAVALELFLISSKDGSTLWQENTVTTSNGFGDYRDIAKGLVENAFKNLMKQ